MKKSELSSYIWKIIWLVGLVIFAIISFNYQTRVQQTVDETYNFIPIIWIDLLITFLFGSSISSLLIKISSSRVLGVISGLSLVSSIINTHTNSTQ
ncbi:hypothetical protein ACL02P_08910 [Paenibacillus sp. MB22_1]